MLDNRRQDTTSEIPFSIQTEKIFTLNQYQSVDSGRGLIGEGLV